MFNTSLQLEKLKNRMIEMWNVSWGDGSQISEENSCKKNQWFSCQKNRTVPHTLAQKQLKTSKMPQYWPYRRAVTIYSWLSSKMLNIIVKLTNHFKKSNSGEIVGTTHFQDLQFPLSYPKFHLPLQKLMLLTPLKYIFFPKFLQTNL